MDYKSVKEDGMPTKSGIYHVILDDGSERDVSLAFLNKDKPLRWIIAEPDRVVKYKFVKIKKV